MVNDCTEKLFLPLGRGRESQEGRREKRRQKSISCGTQHLSVDPHSNREGSRKSKKRNGGTEAREGK